MLLGDFNTLAPGDYDENPNALEALRSVEWMNRVMAEEFQVVPRLLRRGYVDAAGVTGGDQLTFPAVDPLVRIDYIWVSKPLASAVRWCRPWQTEDTLLASDHLPILAEFDD